MANNDNWDDLDDDAGDGSELVKKLRNQLKQANKRNSELETAQADLSKRVRVRDVKEVLEAKGVNPKIARFVLADVEDPTEESVSTWLEENGEMFGVQVQAAADGAAKTEPKGMSADDLVAMNRINDFVDSTTPGGASRSEELGAAIEAAGSVEELMNAIGNPAPSGVTPYYG